MAALGRFLSIVNPAREWLLLVDYLPSPLSLSIAGKLPGSVLNRYYLLGASVHGRLQYAYR